jgi:hypothetical protein
LACACAGGWWAGQREPAFEVYALAGGYVHGNMLLAPQSFSLPPQWRPEVGAGLLAPLGRRWGVLFDVTSSSVADYWKWDGEPGVGPGDNFARLHRITLFPSLVRLWRRERFSIYAGFGPGWEHNRESHRLRRIIARDERGRPVLADRFEDRRASDTKLAPWGLRLGSIVGLSRRVTLRLGWSYLRRYADERGSTGIEAGIGWRF